MINKFKIYIENTKPANRNFKIYIFVKQKEYKLS